MRGCLWCISPISCSNGCVRGSSSDIWLKHLQSATEVFVRRLLNWQCRLRVQFYRETQPLCLSCSTVALDRELSTLQYHLQSVATTGNFLFQNHPQSSRVTISKLSLSTAVSIPHPQVIKCVIQTNFIIITPSFFPSFYFRAA